MHSKKRKGQKEEERTARRGRDNRKMRNEYQEEEETARRG